MYSEKEAYQYFNFLSKVSKVHFENGRRILLEGSLAYTFSDMNGSGCVVPLKGETLVFLKGSDDLVDFLLDASFFRGPYRLGGKSLGNVHAGFLAAWAILKSEAIEAVKELDPYKKQVYTVVGHSLGAALALFMADELKSRGYTVKKVYTAGCPRVGDTAFVKGVLTRLDVTRFVNNYDIVPSAIPRCLGGYKHVGEGVYLRNGTASPKSSYRWNVFGYLISGLADHRVDSYAIHLKSLAGS